MSGGYFWDLRTNTLEQQAHGPIHNPVEILGYGFSEDQVMAEIIMRIEAIPEYVRLFAAAFDEVEPVTEQNILNAIATFERKIIAPDTRFDAFLRGNTTLLTQAEAIGLNKFIDSGCARCHSGPMLSDNVVYTNDIITGERAVRTPTMRNLSLTAPYMHNGEHTTLREAIAVYADRDDLFVTMDEDDIGDIETFLRTLNSVNFYRNIPPSVPSGLPDGGNID